MSTLSDVRNVLIKGRLESALHYLNLAQVQISQSLPVQKEPIPDGSPAECYNLPVWIKRAYKDCESAISQTENALKCAELLCGHK